MTTRSSSRSGRGHSASSSGGGPVGGPAPAVPVQGKKTKTREIIALPGNLHCSCSASVALRALVLLPIYMENQVILL